MKAFFKVVAPEEARRILLEVDPVGTEKSETLSPPGGEDLMSSARNRLSAKVIKITSWGPHYRVAVNCGESRLLAFITRPSFLDLDLREGDVVVASFKATAVHVIRRR